MDNSKTYCVMPHIGMSIQNHGDICACNLNDLSFQKDNNEVIFINRDSLKDSWSSPTRKYLINLLDNNKEFAQTKDNHGCQQCYDQEKAGMRSQRLDLNTMFKDVEELPTQPRVLIIKPGNVCNLACRMCNPETSSGWYTDGHRLATKYEGVTESLAKWTNKFEHIKNGFDEKNSQFWNTFDEWLPNLVFIDIYGGEPFLSNRLFESLRKVADSGAAGNIELQLHTNATIYNEKYLEILSKFKTVSLNLSVDSHVPEHNSYIRSPVNGEILLENITKFKNYVDTHKNNISLGITMTLTIISVYYHEEIYKGLTKFRIPVRLNLVTWPIEYDIRILPIEVKQEILRKNENIDYKIYNSLKDYILQEVTSADQHFKKFWQTTKDLDQFRNQSFKATFSEYYKLLDPYVRNL
jgi:MoaA/NifB/PqqE/SkfB family radical SAM enzyme